MPGPSGHPRGVRPRFAARHQRQRALGVGPQRPEVGRMLLDPEGGHGQHLEPQNAS